VLSIGSVVNGKYRLARLLGDGGMGSVYEAHHEGLGTRVAIKVLHPDLARRTGLVERFLQEARVAAQIRSPHVVQVTDVDRTPNGQAYIVMELLEGEPLAAVLDRQRTLPSAVACEYTLQVLAALEAAHALGVIHRDLKPENVFVTFSGGRPILKLIDFGIAKARRLDPTQKSLTVAGVVMGTAEYMAPEQARSADKVDARADIYAAGVMLYEMIAGTRPVNGDDARVIALRVERGDIVPLVQAAPDTPREIAGLVHRAMAARPELRFATATEMRLALERARPATSAMATNASAAAGPHSGSMRRSTGTEGHAAAHRPDSGAGRSPHDTEAPPVHTLRAVDQVAERQPKQRFCLVQCPVVARLQADSDSVALATAVGTHIGQGIEAIWHIAARSHLSRRSDLLRRPTRCQLIGRGQVDVCSINGLYPLRTSSARRRIS